MSQPSVSLDQTQVVRSGEELDINVLREYLRPVIGDAVKDLQVRQFPGGYSNLTYLLISGEQRWVLRRPPFGSKVKSAHDMGREFKMLTALDGLFPYAPKPVHFCEDHAILGCDFYLMSCIEGRVIRRDYPPELKLTPRQIRQQFFTLFDVLGELHSVDLAKAGLENFGKPVGYVTRQVEGWARRYQAATTTQSPDFRPVIAWLQDKMPAESGVVSIIHNDYKLDNVIWAPDAPLQLVGVLDWEMATVGDPLMDLGCTLGYWVQADDPEYFRQFKSMPSDEPGAPTREQIVARFSEQTGINVGNMDFYFCFGLFRLAGIVQQIYYRYTQGLTKDERFANLGEKVAGLHRMCLRVIERSAL